MREDARDAEIARRRLDEIRDHPERIIKEAALDEKLKELALDAPDRLEQTTQGIPKLPEMTVGIMMEVQRQQLEALRSENAILNDEIAEAKRIYDILLATCDDYEIRLGRDYDGWMPQTVENSVPVLCEMLAEARVELKQKDASIVKV